jgi:hypothetical protein
MTWILPFLDLFLSKKYLNGNNTKIVIALNRVEPSAKVTDSTPVTPCTP